MSTGDGIMFFVTGGLKHTIVPFLYLEKMAIDLTSTFPCGADPQRSRFYIHPEGSQQ